MKKVLFGSTALVAAGAMAATSAVAEEGVKLGLGGYYNTFFWVGDYDEDTADPRKLGATGLFADGEVHFKGKTTLDNGITFGVQIELEAFQSGDQIDENYAFIEGSFGRLVIGGENTAAYMMQYAAPYVGVPLNSGWITSFVPPPVGPVSGTFTTTTFTAGGASVVNAGQTTTVSGVTTGFRTPALSTYVDLINDDHALNYFSPRFSGFQVGASFVPAATINGEGKNFPVEADKNTEMHNVISVGVNFVENPEALERWREAGADVQGERVHIPRGLARKLCSTAPSRFTQHARNPERNVEIGAIRWFVPRSTARPSCATWKAGVATRRLQISKSW